MNVKDLNRKAPDLANAFGMNSTAMLGLLELIEKGKIAKPEKLFKDCAPKLNVTGYNEFTYLNMGKKKYFFFGATCPLGSELNNQLSKVQKELAKSKGKQKELLEAQQLFLEELAALTKKAKGYAYGSIKHARSEEKDGIETCFMEVKKGFSVGKETKKKTLADDVNSIDYPLKSKSGQMMAFEPTTEEDSSTDSTETNNPDTKDQTAPADLVTVKKQVAKLLAEFKGLEPNKAFKGLSLLHTMNTSIEKLEDAPAELKALAQKLEVQKTKLKRVFSKQIGNGFDKGLEKLEEIPVINSTQDLEDIFGTILKMYKGWQKFVPEENHPKKEKIEQVDKEVDVLKEYEKKIVPLRDQHEGMDDSEEKEQLSTQINTLIDEAKVALA